MSERGRTWTLFMAHESEYDPLTGLGRKVERLQVRGPRVPVDDEVEVRAVEDIRRVLDGRWERALDTLTEAEQTPYLTALNDVAEALGLGGGSDAR